MQTIFKVFFEFVTILFLFYALVFWPCGMWDLSSLTRDLTCTPCIGRRSLNHWTVREVPSESFFELCAQSLEFCDLNASSILSHLEEEHEAMNGSYGTIWSLQHNNSFVTELNLGLLCCTAKPIY